MRSVAVAVAVLVCLLAARPVWGQDGAASPPVAEPPTAPALAVHPDAVEIAARRARLAAHAGDEAVVVVLAEGGGGGLTDAARSDDFLYLSTVHEPRAAIVVYRDQGQSRSLLFVEPRRPGFERWNGATAGPGDDTAHVHLFDRALPIASLGGEVAALLATRARLLISASAPDDGGQRRADLEDVLATLLPDASVPSSETGERVPGAGPPDAVSAHPVPAAPRAEDAQALLTDLRAVKSGWELERIRRAVTATATGIRDALRVARPGLAEYQLAAVVELRCKLAGCLRQAFPSIAGSGPNSCILHYRDNVRVLAAEDLVVLDVGGEYDGYAADVTRTFPVSGHFTDEQAIVYDAVLAAQTAALAVVRPGVTLGDVHQAAREVLREHGLDQYFLHGTSHSVGLNVHDVWGRGRKLEIGSVLTVEPGVYIAEKALGVRIEDTVVVTADGYENLSGDLPKTREAIEALMAEEPAFPIDAPR